MSKSCPKCVYNSLFPNGKLADLDCLHCEYIRFHLSDQERSYYSRYLSRLEKMSNYLERHKVLTEDKTQIKQPIIKDAKIKDMATTVAQRTERSRRQPLGRCPKCNGKMFYTEDNSPETSCISCGYHDYGPGFRPLGLAPEWEKLKPSRAEEEDKTPSDWLRTGFPAAYHPR